MSSIVITSIGSLSARLRVTAVKALYGGVIKEGLKWHLTCPNPHWDQVSEEIVPAFDVPPGKYHLSVTYHGDHFDCDVPLEKNTLTDLLLLLTKEGLGDEVDPLKEYERRLKDRDQLVKLGQITNPVKSPYRPEGEHGIGVMPHPLLGQSPQFDGEPQVSPLPSENEEAYRKTLQLQMELQARPTIVPSLNPMKYP